MLKIKTTTTTTQSRRHAYRTECERAVAIQRNAVTCYDSVQSNVYNRINAACSSIYAAKWLRSVYEGMLRDEQYSSATYSLLAAITRSDARIDALEREVFTLRSFWF